MYLFLSGAVLLAVIIALFWLKDELRNPVLARIAYSGIIARLAVLGAVFCVLGVLMMISD
jgi:predicted phage tail protein